MSFGNSLQLAILFQYKINNDHDMQSLLHCCIVQYMHANDLELRAYSLLHY